MDLDEINRSKMAMFKDNIKKQSDSEIEMLAAKIRGQKNAVSFANEESAAREAIAEIRKEQSAFESRYKRELSRCDYEASIAVKSHRKMLCDEFFEDMKKELEKFSKSGEYEDYLKRSVGKAHKAIGEKCVILAKADDVEKVKKLCENEVRADSTILLGGVGALDEEKGLFCDLTLDKALDDEKKAFVNKKELRI